MRREGSAKHPGIVIDDFPTLNSSIPEFLHSALLSVSYLAG
jgi:hypothetical protein